MKAKHWNPWKSSLFVALMVAVAALVGCGVEPEFGTKEHAIIDGAVDLRLPSVVAFTADRMGTFCSGTLIAPTRVLTAAHCIDAFDALRKQGANKIEVRFDRLNEDGKTYNMYYYGIAKSHRHPEYALDAKTGTPSHDLAIVVLDRSATFPVIPLSAVSMNDSWVGKELFFMGYGVKQAKPTKVASKHKRSASIPIHSVQGLTFGTYSKAQRICNGDSGGPAFRVDQDGTPHLVGVTSYGIGTRAPDGANYCDGIGYSVRVDMYLKWIRSHLKSEAPKSQCKSSDDCGPKGECRSAAKPWEGCGAGERCICLPQGTRELGQSCSPAQACVRGALCTRTGNGSYCMEPCDPNQSQACSQSGGTCSIKTETPGLFLCGCQSDNQCSSGNRCKALSQQLAMCVESSDPSGASQPQANSASTAGSAAPPQPQQLGCQSQAGTPVNGLSVFLLLGLFAMATRRSRA